MTPPESPKLDASRWVAEHGDALFRFALLRARDRTVAEDLVQETFLAALKTRHSYQGQAAERTWLIGILKHKLIDHLRQASRESHPDDMDAEVDAYFDKQGNWAAPPSLLENPLSRSEQAELRRHLDACLEDLPDRLSRAFVLTQVDGVESDETCKVLGITTTNLWVMLHRARLRLRHCLEHKGFGRDRE